MKDANRSILLTVTDADNAVGRKKEAKNCALAKACVREGKADGAIIGISFSYLVKGTTATRYRTSVTVSREITSFDRHQHFEPGRNYRLGKIGPTTRLGRSVDRTKYPTKNKRKMRKGLEHTHRTANIRVAGQ